MNKKVSERKKGRPSLYKPEYCQMIIDYMSRGHAIVEFAAHINVCRDTIHEWSKSHPDFFDALRKAKAKCEAWWVNKSMENLDNPRFKDAMWKFHMAARFRWSDKQELELSTKKDEKLVIDLGDNDKE